MRLALVVVLLIAVVDQGAWAAETPRVSQGFVNDEAGFESIFSGQDLAGWEGDPKVWTVRDGAILCNSPKDGQRNWLVWRGGEPGDFELRLRFRYTSGNSGVQVRSTETKKCWLCGYQVEVAERDVMGLWHHSIAPEKYRAELATAGQRAHIRADGSKEVEAFADPKEVQRAYRENDWNDLTVIVQGNRLVQIINGVVFAELIDEDQKFATRSGLIGFQDHGRGTVAEFKDIRIKSLATDNRKTAKKGTFPSWRRLSSENGDLPLPNGGTQQTACLVLDVDKDKLNDIVIAERSAAPAVVWLRRTSEGWSKYVIEDGRLPIAAGGASCDIDADGDLDLVFGSAAPGTEVWWLENPAPDFAVDRPWKRRTLATTKPGMHHDQWVDDFLGQGKSQVVSWHQHGNALLLYSIPENPREAAQWPSITVGDLRGEGLCSADIDGDGKHDLLGGGRWFKHRGGTEFTAHLIDDAQRESRIAAGDLKQGGRPEVVMVPGDGVGRLKWYEAVGDPTSPESWIGHDLLDHDVDRGHSLQVADINGDGHLDVFCAEMARWNLKEGKTNNPNATASIFYGDGLGGFTRQEVARGYEFHESKAADLDGDGLLDIVAKPFAWKTPRIDVWLQEAK
ncbi:MAG: family 16 glycoside hydrolase [Planctomycetota bacterium]